MDNQEKTNQLQNQDENYEKSLRLLGDLISLSTEKTVKAINNKNLLENVAIFVDYDNVYWTLKKYFNHDPDHEDPQKNLFIRLWEKYGQDHVRTFRVYADFEKVKTSLTNLQKKRIQIRHVYSKDKDSEYRKNSSDIELCIDAIESTYKDPNITCYVFVTADSDMIPILSRMMYKGKRVELYYLEEAAPKYVDINTYVHYSEDLTHFLNIEKVSYNPDDFIIQALVLIQEWEHKYKDDGDYYLGSSWLKNHMAENLGIPEIVASEIIERLKTEEYIFDGMKILSNGQRKTSITLADKAKKFLQEISYYDSSYEVASSTKKIK